MVQSRPTEFAELGVRHAGLTRRQVEIARLLPSGVTGVGAARRMMVSESTIRTQVRKMLEQTGLPNLQAFAVWAYVHWECCLDAAPIAAD